MKFFFLCLSLLVYFNTAACAADTPRTVVKANFATTDPAQVASPDTPATLTNDPAQEVDGARSLLGDSRTSGSQWNEFFHSKAGLFQADQAYDVSFDYKVIARAPGATFYALFRRQNGSGTDGWTQWKGSPGSTGHVTLSLATRNAGDYYLIIGIENKGAEAINNLIIQTDPAHRPLVGVWPAPVRTWTSPGHTRYYMDSVHGNDAHSGRSPSQAWRTLARVNAGTFAPGDTILLAAGSHWTGFLAPGGSGTPTAPIRMTRYGTGPLPAIDAQGHALATLYLSNVQGWEVSDLNITNTSHVPQPHLTGVTVSEFNFGVAHHIVLKGLFVHNVNGSDVKAEGGGSGISCTCGGSKVRSRFDGLMIEHCHLVHTDRNGITMGGNWTRDATWFPSLHVVIQGNLLEDIGGDGIVPLACDGALVADNILRGGRMRAKDYAAGIWPWSCDNTVIEHNFVSGMHGTHDGEGYDSDYNCRNTLFQDNVSEHNDGGFMLICDDGSQHLPWNIGNQGTIIRDNISINDRLHTFNITGPCQNTTITNNVFYIGPGQSVTAVNGGNWGGPWPSDTRFLNNLFYAAGHAGFSMGGMAGTVFNHNDFWGHFTGLPTDAHALHINPKLTDPGSLTPAAYRPLPGSPLLHAGVAARDLGLHGFGGGPVTHPPAIGAFQTP